MTRATRGSRRAGAGGFAASAQDGRRARRNGKGQVRSVAPLEGGSRGVGGVVGLWERTEQPLCQSAGTVARCFRRDLRRVQRSVPCQVTGFLTTRGRPSRRRSRPAAPARRNILEGSSSGHCQGSEAVGRPFGLPRCLVGDRVVVRDGDGECRGMKNRTVTWGLARRRFHPRVIGDAWVRATLRV